MWLKSTKMEAQRCVRRSRDAHEAIPEPSGTQKEVRTMATKDKNTKKSMEKKPAQKTLKEKRQAKKAKK